MKKNPVDSYLLYVMLVVGFIFLKSGYGKVAGGKFVGDLSKTLGFFAGENPYPLVSAFLKNVAIPNATLFGTMTMWGEIYVGLSLFVSVGYLLMKKTLTPVLYFVLISGLVTAAVLNTTFLLSAGWTGASTESVNLLMLAISIISLIYTLKTLTHIRNGK